MLGLFHRKPKFAIHDKYLVHLTFDPDFAPDQNDATKNIVDTISEQAEQLGEPALADTLPFATLKAAEELFEQMSEQFYQNADLLKGLDDPEDGIPFKEVAIWQLNTSKKISRHNPTEFIKIENFKVPEDWQNLTKPLFEEIFTNPANSGFDYDAKKQICEDFAETYKEVVGTDDNNIATIPAPGDLDSGNVSCDVPALSPALEDSSDTDDEIADIINDNPVVDQPDNKDNSTVYYDPSSATFSNNQDTTTEQPVVTKEKPDNEQPVVASKKATRSERSSANDDTDDVQTDLLNKGNVIAPQFDIEEIDQVGPADDRYVAYMLNQKAKTFNKRLKELAKQLSTSNYKALTKLSIKYSDEIDVAERDYWLKHGNDLQLVAQQVIEEYQKKKKKELNQQLQANEARRKADLDDAKRVYDQSVQKINNDADQNADDITKQIEKKYHDQALRAASDAQDKKAEELDVGKTKVREANTRRFNVQLQSDAGGLVSDATELLQQQFDLNNEALDEYRIKVTSEHLAAVRDEATRTQADAEKARMVAPTAELREANKDLTETKTQNAKIEAELSHQQKLNAELKAQIEGLSSRNRQLIDEKAAESKLAIANSVKKGFEDDSLFNQYLKMKLTESLQPKQENNAALDQAKQQLQASQQAFKGLKRLTGMVTVALLLIIGGGGYFAYHQQQDNSARISALQDQLSKKPKTTVHKDKVVSATSAAAKATTALHANDQKELDRYSNEPYYDLDKAIIANDDKAADAAAQKLASYDLHDSYRSTQTVSLLNKAGNSDLANKIANANK